MLKFIYGPNNEIKGIDSGDNSFKTYSNHPMHTAEFFGVSSGQRGTDSTPAVGINISRGTISSPENTQPGDILATFAIRGKYNDYHPGAIAITGQWDRSADLSNSNPASIMHFFTGNNKSDFNRMSFDSQGALGVPVIQSLGITTTERDALTSTNGMIIYNIDIDKFQGCENGVWVNLIP